MNNQYLRPLPDITDNNLQHSFKKISHSYVKSVKPPKLYPKHHDNSFNKNLNTSSVANAISFREYNSPLGTGVTGPTVSAGQPLTSPIYQPEINVSYFEQCFEVISKLGEGSFGEVFKVRSRENGKLYAIKKSKDIYRSECYRQERLEEVRRYEQLSLSEHCITFYKAWEQDNRLYIQLELCQGSLEAYVYQNKQISESKIWSFLLDILLALKSLHDKNLIHLDIKLDNILVTDDEVCKLGDFGLVVELGRPNLDQSLEGDCRYIAPEIMQGHFSKAADIFSFGITMLELATNLDLPRNGPLWQELRCGSLPQVCTELISKDLKEIIECMITPDPHKRPDVNSLLMCKKIQDLLLYRKRWSLYNNIKKIPINFVRSVWQIVIFSFFIRILIKTFSRFTSFFRLTNIKQSKSDWDHSLSPSSYNDGTPNNSFSSSPISQSALSRFSPNMSNSTPLNRHHGSFIRIRKELSTLNFELNNSSGIHDDDGSCANDSCKESSSFIRKKLFLKPEESDYDE